MNSLTSFQLHKSSVRGRFVRLESLTHEIISRHQYPEVINQALREMIPIAIALAGAFKFEGLFTLQIQGIESPVRFMVVDVDSKGHVRACANFDEGKVAEIAEEKANITTLFGQGYMAFTIDQGEHTDRYQGVVELEGQTFADCLKHYFHQSEQLETSFHVTSDKTKAACLMIQKLPFNAEIDNEDFDGWFTANSLLSTLKKEEALGEVPPEEIIRRLFWQEGLETYDTKSYSFKCRCSREKIEAVISNLSEEEEASIVKDGKITVTCDYCAESYQFLPRSTK